jgi:filamentous hemagglutinin family protein
MLMRFFVSFLVGICGALGVAQSSWAQTIVGQEGTIVKATGGDFAIDGGVLVDNNLFHSFAKFGLAENRSATFYLANPQIANIFSRVTGGDPSALYGMVQVVGGDKPHFYLMNPAGIIFGPNFQFPTTMPLTATTANGMAFGGQWWNATGVNNYATLGKAPTGFFGFTSAQPAAIINQWASGSTPLTLVGGTVISPADAAAKTGEPIANNLTIVAVPGNHLVRITSTDSLLGLEIRPFAAGESLPNAGGNAVPSLAQLITGPAPGGGAIGDATGLTVNADGQVFLSGASVSPGDVYAGNLTAKGVLIGAPVGNVTVSTIEAQDLGVQVTAGQRFQATGSRVYDNVKISDDRFGTARASIAVSNQRLLVPGTVSITHGGGSSLSVSGAAVQAAGNAVFVLGGPDTPMAIPLDASGTVNAIIVRSNSGSTASLAVAYANQTFGQTGSVPGATLTTTMARQSLTIESPAEPPTVNDRTQANHLCASTQSSGTKRTIVAWRSASRQAVSGNCATDSDDTTSDDTTILKILE